jgi:hypothetical protein
MIQVKLKGQEYNAKLDFRTLANIQGELRKRDIKIGFQEIFERIQEQDFMVITEIIVQSILRCHTQLKRHHIEDKLDLDELVNALSFVAELVQASITVDEGKPKEEIIPQ